MRRLRGDVSVRGSSATAQIHEDKVQVAVSDRVSGSLQEVVGRLRLILLLEAFRTGWIHRVGALVPRAFSVGGGRDDVRIGVPSEIPDRLHETLAQAGLSGVRWTHNYKLHRIGPFSPVRC